MSRGLGKLQKAILQIAYRKQKEDCDARVMARDVLIEYYGFPSLVDISTAPIGCPAFSVQWIGRKRYMSASVTVAQCFDRLAARGLVERVYGEGVRLTEAGSKVTEASRLINH